LASPDVKKLLAEPQPTCFGCGEDNPRGLKLCFSTGTDNRVSAAWVPEEFCEGLRGIVHGGLVSTVLDEAMAKAVIGAGIQALTCDLRVRFRRPAIAGQALVISGWLVSRDRRRVRTEATISNSEGSELAHGWATFLAL